MYIDLKHRNALSRRKKTNMKVAKIPIELSYCIQYSTILELHKSIVPQLYLFEQTSRVEVCSIEVGSYREETILGHSKLSQLPLWSNISFLKLITKGIRNLSAREREEVVRW
jgi:hypothetical protein